MISRRISTGLLAISATSVLVAGCSNSVSASIGAPSDGAANSNGSSSGAPASVPPASAPATPAASAPQSASGASAGSTRSTCTYVPTGNAARTVSLPPVTPLSPSRLTLAMRVDGKPVAPIRITFEPATAPCTVGSIAHLAMSKFYDVTQCHRLTTSGIYVLQCGDPTATGTGGPGYSFPDELSGTETYPAGTVAMANNGPDTNGSQFFLVYKASQLPPSYTVFGTISSGLGVLDSIAAAGTAQPAGDGTPKQPVVIATATVS